MPNYATTSVTFKGPKEDRDRLKQLASGEYPFDLNKVSPMPESLDVAGSIDEALAVTKFRDTGQSPELTAMLQNPWYREHDIVSETQLANYLEERHEKERSAPVPSGSRARHPSENLPLLELGRLLVKNVEQHGFATWFDWRNHHWGTKNMYECEVVCDDEDRLAYRFDTAWQEPLPIFDKLKSMFPALIIDVHVVIENEVYYDYTL